MQLNGSYHGILQGTQEGFYYKINDYNYLSQLNKPSFIQSKFHCILHNQNHQYWECLYKVKLQALIKNKRKVVVVEKSTSTQNVVVNMVVIVTTQNKSILKQPVFKD
jgi:hypothetical protein